MNLLQLIRSFTRTAETGSIAAAARTLGISATAVGQNINRLEAHLGVRLLNRSTRQLALSEAGTVYLALPFACAITIVVHLAQLFAPTPAMAKE
ncbi:HTH-type transcriptional regulator TdfR [compost metagenome]